MCYTVQCNIVLSKILPHYSTSVGNALQNNLVVLKSLGGASNLAHDLADLKHCMCKFVVLMDNDRAGIDAAEKAINNGFATEAEIKYTTCPGSPEAEFEDCLQPSLYAATILEKFSVNINCSQFRGNAKWSDSETYEVIDGQQRLTTLFILVKCLHEIGVITESIPDTLRFSCRDKSNYTLKNLHRLIDEDHIEERIRAGKDIVMSGLRTLDVPSFLAKMKKVVLYRVEVPARTDLNRYFEIMNTRGEQLEQHDILKAALMNCLTDGDEKAGFAAIWDACSDMTGYVQMHFSVKAREVLFGREWRNVPEYTSVAVVSRDKADGRKK